MQSLTSLDDILSDNAIEQYISRLRRRIAPLDLNLRTVRGIGYLLEKATGQPMTPYSLRRRLLLWLLLATALIGLVALLDTWREALRTAQGVSDRVLVGSALAIAERVTVDESGLLEVDIPYSSLEMLTSPRRTRCSTGVDGPVGSFLTGYEDLAVNPAPPGGVAFADGMHGEVGIRSATLMREVSTGKRSIPFSVTVAESTLARSALARDILVRSALRLAVLIAGVGAIVWIAVTLALRPLNRLGAIIAERSPADLRAVTVEVPQEVAALVSAINSFMARLETALDALRHFTGNASHQLAHAAGGGADATGADRPQRHSRSGFGRHGQGPNLAGTGREGAGATACACARRRRDRGGSAATGQHRRHCQGAGRRTGSRCAGAQDRPGLRGAGRRYGDGRASPFLRTSQEPVGQRNRLCWAGCRRDGPYRLAVRQDCT